MLDPESRPNRGLIQERIFRPSVNAAAEMERVCLRRFARKPHHQRMTDRLTRKMDYMREEQRILTERGTFGTVRHIVFSS